MQFRTVNDLFACVRKNGYKFPRDVDLVVGVPRSGILAGCAVSLMLHKPFVDLNSFLNGQLCSDFSRRNGIIPPPAGERLAVLIVDDSILTGNAMRLVRNAIDSSGQQHRVTYAAVYGKTERHVEVNMVLEVCPPPRVFEWNIMNHAALSYCCVDLDGVLCVDPSAEENDDGSKYIDFVRNARVLNQPHYSIHSIVTSRLEQYRHETEGWLERNGIRHKNLFMLDVATAEERRRNRLHGKFKAKIFSSQPECILFIESERLQANEIHELTGKPTLAYRDMELFSEFNAAKLRLDVRKTIGKFLPPWSKPFIKSALRIS
jgi:uncharacterized HAD superfamily protein/hypoxanthine phosphoribosyltransferase